MEPVQDEVVDDNIAEVEAGFEHIQAADVMVVFDTEDAADGADAQTKLGQLKMKSGFNKKDVVFWFVLFEAKLSEISVKRQLTKRTALINQLPDDVIEEVKSILRKTPNGGVISSDIL